MYAKKSLWQTEQNYFKAEDYFASMLDNIDLAENMICLETYIFDFDHLGKRFLEKLKAAKNRGVEIKVLIDGVGSMNDIDRVMCFLQDANISFKIYHPLPWNFKAYQYAINKGVFFEKLLHFTGHINHRDHRKLCIIDNTKAWTGSYNITSTHLSREQEGQGWKDHGIQVSGQHVSHLAEEFLSLWQNARKRPIYKSLPFILSSLNPLKRRHKIQRICSGIEQAKKRIWIANAYFAPHHSIISALIKAKKKGIDIRIMVGGKSDIFFFPDYTRTFYSDLLNAGIDIFEWHNSVLHSKIVLIDDYCYSGSSNLNNRSHYHDLELDILVCLEKTIRELETQMSNDFNQCKAVHKKTFFQNAVYIYIAGFLPKLLRYWL